MKKLTALLLSAALMCLAACGRKSEGEESMDKGMGYKKISQEEAARMMEEQPDKITIVDVRTITEFREGHIPGAINIPNESIENDPPTELPDKDRILLIYCRSGNRSKLASEKLAAMGYTNIFEFGGINTWEGETERGDAPEDTGADLSNRTLILETGGEALPVTWEDSAAVDSLKRLVSDGPLTIKLAMYGGNEQFGSLGRALDSDDVSQTSKPGDIMLYTSDQIVLFYGSNTWQYTKLGHIDKTADEMTELLGNGDIEITIRITE